MAGIQEAMKRVMEHRNKGKVIAKGKLKFCTCEGEEECSQCSQTSYLIINLTCGNGGYITVYDYHSDIRIHPDVEVLDDVILLIQSNWNAIWMREEDIQPEGSGICFDYEFSEEGCPQNG